MRILIGSGIFEPESGGPATYAPMLARGLVEAGHTVTVVAYSDEATYERDSSYPFRLIRIRRRGKLLNTCAVFMTVRRLARAHDVVYSLDWLALGLPLSVACIVSRTPYMVRFGGDLLWEQRFLVSGKKMSLREFYDRKLYRGFRYFFLFSAIRFVLAHAAWVVFNSDAQRELYKQPYGLDPQRSSTIANAFPNLPRDIVRGEPNDEFVFAGRLVPMKNIPSLLRAFALADIRPFRLLLIGDGPSKHEVETLVQELGLSGRVSMLPGMTQMELLKRIKNCRALILPSWTDISPNQIYEAVRLGLPALVTKENFLPFRNLLPDMIDPYSVDDIAAKLRRLADKSGYEAFVEAFRKIPIDRSWYDILNEHLSIFTTIKRV